MTQLEQSVVSFGKQASVHLVSPHAQAETHEPYAEHGVEQWLSLQDTHAELVEQVPLEPLPLLELLPQPTNRTPTRPSATMPNSKRCMRDLRNRRMTIA